MTELMHNFRDFMERGGVAMWPLLVMSIVALALILERAIYWLRVNRGAHTRKAHALAQLLRERKPGEAAGLLNSQPDGLAVYGPVTRSLIDATSHNPPVNLEAAATEAVERVRPGMERFMPTLSTIITAAPMVGILGTVLGLMQSLGVLAEQAGSGAAGDPASVGPGIAQALLTTAAGLVIAIAVLFPYNAFRAQIDRTLGRIDMLVAAAGYASGKTDE